MVAGSHSFEYHSVNLFACLDDGRFGGIGVHTGNIRIGSQGAVQGRIAGEGKLLGQRTGIGLKAADVNMSPKVEHFLADDMLETGNQTYGQDHDGYTQGNGANGNSDNKCREAAFLVEGNSGCDKRRSIQLPDLDDQTYGIFAVPLNASSGQSWPFG